MNRIDFCLEEYRRWSEMLGIKNSADINRMINSGKASVLINLSETFHEQKISEIARTVSNHIDEKKIILISGPSSSGKTSFSMKLRLHLRVLGINSVTISLDNYYIKPELMPLGDDGKPDFEALESIDYRRFNDDIYQLLEKGSAEVPEYDFLTGSVSSRLLTLAKNEIIITEGIHGLNEKLAENIPEDMKYRIYCTPLSDIAVNDGKTIKPSMCRFMRRMVRDYYFRRADFRLSFALWPNAEKGAEKNIYPLTERADIIFNSALLYEPAVYRPHLHKILADVPDDFEEIETVRNILSATDSFDPVDASLIPPSSIIKEFIGGSSLF